MHLRDITTDTKKNLKPDHCVWVTQKSQALKVMETTYKCVLNDYLKINDIFFLNNFH